MYGLPERSEEKKIEQKHFDTHENSVLFEIEKFINLKRKLKTGRGGKDL